jgi:broad specificity phosphatase PhoE
MIIYITRHGQPTTSKDDLFTRGDPPLSRLGGVQASLLGRRLKAMEFTGTILASPYLRTSHTANFIARELDTTFRLAPDFREYAVVGIEEFTGPTLAQLHQECERLEDNADLPFPWWTVELEDFPMVCRRVGSFLAELTAKTSEDILLVGHGASVEAGMHCLLHEHAPKALAEKGHNWNCFLSAIRVKPVVEPLFLCNVDHLPLEKTTSNHASYEEIREKLNRTVS